VSIVIYNYNHVWERVPAQRRISVAREPARFSPFSIRSRMCGPSDTSSRALSKRAKRGPCDRLQTRDQFNHTSAEQKNFRRGEDLLAEYIYRLVVSSRVRECAREAQKIRIHVCVTQDADAGNRYDFRIRHGDSAIAADALVERFAPILAHFPRATCNARVSRRRLSGTAPETNGEKIGSVCARACVCMCEWVRPNELLRTRRTAILLREY